MSRSSQAPQDEFEELSAEYLLKFFQTPRGKKALPKIEKILREKGLPAPLYELSKESALKLGKLLQGAGIYPKIEYLESIMRITDECLRPHFDSFVYSPDGIQNQDALIQLINALGALGLDGQFFLSREFLCKIAQLSKTPTGDEPNLTFQFDTLLETARGCIKEKLEPFQDVRKKLFEEMELFFKQIGLNPSGKDAALFDAWMKIVLANIGRQ